MPRVTGLSHVVLHVRDLEKMTTFYRDVLGLTVNQGTRDPERLVFLTSDPEVNDHELALTRGRDGDAKIIAHIAFRVSSIEDVKAYYDRFVETGVPIDHMVSHAYVEEGNTVSCYFLDPEGNRLEVYSVVTERDKSSQNRPLDLSRSLEDIVTQASGLTPSAV